MDPSSPYAMQRLIGFKDKYDIAFACDTDHDRHGIVTASAGLLPPNHYLSVAIDYLFRHRPRLEGGRRGRQDRREQRHDRSRRPRGSGARCTKCRWASNGSWRAASTASSDSAARKARAPRSCRIDGSAWTTDKDGIVPCAAVGGDHGAHRPRSRRGVPRADARTRRAVRRSRRRPRDARAEEEARQARPLAGAHRPKLAGETHRAGADARARQRCADRRRQGRLAKSGWFAARPSGTEDIYKIYAESFSRRAAIWPADRPRRRPSSTPRSPDAGRCPCRSRRARTERRRQAAPALAGGRRLLHGIARHDDPEHGRARHRTRAQGAAARHEGRARELHA